VSKVRLKTGGDKIIDALPVGEYKFIVFRAFNGKGRGNRLVAPGEIKWLFIHCSSSSAH
jgi:hypothetical protein